jgi:rhamnosyltransferase
MVTGQIHWLAYFTIIGRIDQFTLGIPLFHTGQALKRRHLAAASSLLALSAVYYAFDRTGGWYGPSQATWIVLPTIEGALVSLLIAYYDHTPFRVPKPLSCLATIGGVSYSMYLLHPFYVFLLSALADFFFHPTFYESLCLGTLAFLATVPVARVSFALIEKPFLALRVSYRRTPPADLKARSSDRIPSKRAPAANTMPA